MTTCNKSPISIIYKTNILLENYTCFFLYMMFTAMVYEYDITITILTNSEAINTYKVF